MGAIRDLHHIARRCARHKHHHRPNPTDAVTASGDTFDGERRNGFFAARAALMATPCTRNTAAWGHSVTLNRCRVGIVTKCEVRLVGPGLPNYQLYSA